MARGAVSVRAAVPADAPAMAALWGEIRSASNGAGSLVSAPTEERVLKALAAVEADDRARILVAQVDDAPGQIVGMAVLQHNPLAPLFDIDCVQVSYLHVSRGWQGRGVGKALVGEAAALAEDGHIEHVVVSVFPSAARGPPLLRPAGLRADGDPPGGGHLGAAAQAQRPAWVLAP